LCSQSAASDGGDTYTIRFTVTVSVHRSFKQASAYAHVTHHLEKTICLLFNKVKTPKHLLEWSASKLTPYKNYNAFAFQL